MVNSLPDEELVGKRPLETAKKAGIEEGEMALFSLIVQTRIEINQAVEAGELTLDEAEEWRKEFGFIEDEG